MKMKNMKVRFSLLLGYGVTIGISIIMIVICLMSSSKQQKNFDRIIDEYVYANELVTNCRLNANIAARNVREITLFPGTATSAQLRTRIDEVMEELDGQLEDLDRVNPVKDGSIVGYISKVREWQTGRRTDSERFGSGKNGRGKRTD